MTIILGRGYFIPFFYGLRLAQGNKKQYNRNCQSVPDLIRDCRRLFFMAATSGYPLYLLAFCHFDQSEAFSAERSKKIFIYKKPKGYRFYPGR